MPLLILPSYLSSGIANALSERYASQCFSGELVPADFRGAISNFQGNIPLLLCDIQSFNCRLLPPHSARGMGRAYHTNDLPLDVIARRFLPKQSSTSKLISFLLLCTIQSIGEDCFVGLQRTQSALLAMTYP